MARVCPSTSTPTRRFVRFRAHAKAHATDARLCLPQELLKSLGLDSLNVNVVSASTAFERPRARGPPGSRPRRDNDA